MTKIPDLPYRPSVNEQDDLIIIDEDELVSKKITTLNLVNSQIKDRTIATRPHSFIRRSGTQSSTTSWQAVQMNYVDSDPQGMAFGDGFKITQAGFYWVWATAQWLGLTANTNALMRMSYNGSVNNKETFSQYYVPGGSQMGLVMNTLMRLENGDTLTWDYYSGVAGTLEGNIPTDLSAWRYTTGARIVRLSD